MGSTLALELKSTPHTQTWPACSSTRSSASSLGTDAVHFHHPHHDRVRPPHRGQARRARSYACITRRTRAASSSSRESEQGYARYFASELEDDATVLLSAVNDTTGAVVVATRTVCIEGRDWNMLLDRHGALHDVFVADEARGTRVGERLVREMCSRLESIGAPRILLSTMVTNVPAQRLFEKCGFRPTMIEMTRERMPDGGTQ